MEFTRARSNLTTDTFRETIDDYLIPVDFFDVRTINVNNLYRDAVQVVHPWDLVRGMMVGERNERGRVTDA
jgi:hypothetical protein